MTAPERMAADFRKAAGIIRTGGLSRGSFVDMAGARCAAGAVIDAVTGYDEGVHGTYVRREQSAQEHLQLLALQLGWSWATLGTPLGTIAAWNDAEARTAEQVATELEQVADELTAKAVTS